MTDAIERALISGATAEHCTYCDATPGRPCRADGYHLARFLGLKFTREEAAILERAADGPFPAGIIRTTAAPEVIVRAWCKQCEASTASLPCELCGGPSCADCGRCPPCDGDLPGEEE